MQSRAFNYISIDHRHGIFTKSSRNIEKLKDEVNYYLNIPESLSDLFPTLVDYSQDYSAYQIEYFPFKNLADTVLTNCLSLEKGKIIISTLMDILEKIHSVQPTNYIDKANMEQFYIQKTLDRIELFASDTPSLFIEPVLTINGITYKNFAALENEFINLMTRLSKKHTHISAVHGDFCLSNILYSNQDNIIKLIDPRGSFGDIGIYGDSNYDYAKLLHCLHGRYDYLVNGFYELEEINTSQFSLNTTHSDLLDQLYYFYINSLIEKEVSMEFIYLIEASLFLSMTPLHYENKQRQKALYLTGIIILNDVINGYYMPQNIVTSTTN
ncbi:MAG TPA: hypothetical protein PK657_06075 [Legionella sp.]|nr:hypothetical protein [Legionella sp.]